MPLRRRADALLPEGAVQALALVGFGSSVVASLWVGSRLLLLARRTRQAPELAIGLSLFMGGGVGYLLIMLSYGLRALPPAWTPAGLIAGSFCTCFGVVALGFGVARIFRPRDAWAGRVATLLSIVLAATIVGRLAEPLRMPAAPWIFWTSTLASAACYAWSTFESFRYHTQMRRRAQIGLADADIARRFLLWGTSAAAAVGMHVASAWGRLSTGSGASPRVMGVISLLCLVAALGIWLAFFPPRRRRLGAAPET